MASRFFTNFETSDVGTNKYLELTATASSSANSASTVAGPTSGVAITPSWISKPLGPMTISGTITANLVMSESSMSANAGAQVLIERCNNAGTVLSTISNSEKGTELPTSGAAQNWAITPTSTTINGGDRIKVTVMGNDAGGTMASGHTFQFNYGGTAGQSYVEFTENLVEQTAPTIALNTADAFDFGSDTTPTLEFTGTDGQSDDIRYNVQIDTSSSFELADSYAEANQSTVIGMYTALFTGVSQSFTGDGYPINSVKFYLSKTGSPTGNVTAKLYASTGTHGSTAKPTGATLASSNSIDASTLTTSLALYEFTFATPYTGANGTVYCITIEYTGGTSANKVNVGSDNTSPTHSGNSATLFSPDWTSSATSDIIFYLYTATLIDKTSGTDAGFLNTVNGADTDPFTSGQKVSYTVQSGDALSSGTWYWRARASDPNGMNTYSAWPTARSFTVTVGGNQTVTPITASLTTTTFAPVIQHTITIPVASLTTSTFAPTVILGTIITPPTATLTISAFAPTVTATQNQSVTPSTASLTTTTFAPTVTTSDHKVVTPTTASLTITSFSPVIDLKIIPSTAALSLTAFAPTVTATNNQSVTPATASLTTTTYAPQVNLAVIPSTAALSLTTFAPSIIQGTVATPATQALTLTTFAPTVAASDHKTVTPDTVTLTTSAFAPTVTASDNKTVTPTTASLTLATFAPTVTASNNQSVTPTTASLSLSTFAPTVINGYVVTPATQSLTTSTFAPAVVASDHKIVTPLTSSLTLSTFIPTVTTDNNITVTPNTYTLSTEAFAPTVSATNHQTVTPSTAALSLNNYAPSITVGSGTEQPRSLLTLGVG